MCLTVYQRQVKHKAETNTSSARGVEVCDHVTGSATNFVDGLALRINFRERSSPLVTGRYVTCLSQRLNACLKYSFAYTGNSTGAQADSAVQRISLFLFNACWEMDDSRLLVNIM